MYGLEETPIIAAVRNAEQLSRACNSPAANIFILHCDILGVQRLIDAVHSAKKRAFVHIDMAEGIGRDRFGLSFLKNSGADGIITTKNSLIASANDAGLITVQRLFLIDSMSLSTALENMRSARPAMAELMPAVATRAIAKFVSQARIPVIAGGLIQTKQDIVNALNAGAAGVSTATETLWYE